MRTRKGNTSLVVAVSLTSVIGFAALVVDLGWGRVVKQELQNTADAAAHAATVQLDGTAAGVTLARSSAKSVAAANVVAGGHISVPDDDIEFGVYDDGAWTASTDATVINAVRVRAERSDLGLFFAPVAFGRDAVDVGANSTMVAEFGGAGEAECYLPFAIPSCLIAAHGGSLSSLQTVEFKLNPAGIDNLGWALPNGTPSASSSRDLISNNCSQPTAEIGDPVGLQNGAVTSALADLATAVNGSSTRWSTTLWGPLPARNAARSSITAANWGRTFEGVVAVFDGGTEYCKSSAPWNSDKPIVGFMWGAVFDVWNSGATSERTIRMRLDVTGTRGSGTGDDGGGGPDWGVTAESPPHMVVE
jgi:hypothetical protein